MVDERTPTRMFSSQNWLKKPVVFCAVMGIEACKIDSFIVQVCVLDFGGKSRL